MNEPNLNRNLEALEKLQHTTDPTPLTDRLSDLGQTVDQYILGYADAHQVLVATRQAQNAYQERLETIGTALQLFHAIVHTTNPDGNNTVATRPEVQQAMEWLHTEQHLLREAAGQLSDTLDLLTTVTRFNP